MKNYKSNIKSHLMSRSVDSDFVLNAINWILNNTDRELRIKLCVIGALSVLSITLLIYRPTDVESETIEVFQPEQDLNEIVNNLENNEKIVIDGESYYMERDDGDNYGNLVSEMDKIIEMQVKHDVILNKHEQQLADIEKITTSHTQRLDFIHKRQVRQDAELKVIFAALEASNIPIDGKDKAGNQFAVKKTEANGYFYGMPLASYLFFGEKEFNKYIGKGWENNIDPIFDKLDEYIDIHYPICIEREKKTGISRFLYLAQGIYENNAGTSKVYRLNLNHAGLKCREGVRHFKKFGANSWHCRHFPDDNGKNKGRDMFRKFENHEQSYLYQWEEFYSLKRYSDFVKTGKKMHSKEQFKTYGDILVRETYATNKDYSFIIYKYCNAVKRYIESHEKYKNL